MFRRKAKHEPIIITVAEAIDPTHTVVLRCMNRTLTAEQAKQVKDHIATLMSNRVLIVGSDWEWLVFEGEGQRRDSKRRKAGLIPSRPRKG